MTVARSVHQDAHDFTAHDRGIGLALLASLLIHAPLLLMTGEFGLGPLHITQPPLQVHIERPEAPVATVNIPLKTATPEVEAFAPRATEPDHVPEASGLQNATVDDRIIVADSQPEELEAPEATRLGSPVAETEATPALDEEYAGRTGVG